MKPVIEQRNQTHYVSESDFIKFVTQNSNYEWNEVCDICRSGVFNEGGITYFPEKPIYDDYSKFTTRWVCAFFDAHPFMNKITFVFDS